MKLSEAYSAKLTFYKDSQRVKIELRTAKKSRKSERIIDIPEYINPNELSWQRIMNRYRKGSFAVYERGSDNNYTNLRGEISPTNLTQMLDRLILENLDRVLKG